jgi:hypothetical protein
MEEKIQALLTAHEYIEKVYIGVQQATESFRIGDDAEGNNTLTQIIDGFKWIIEVLTLTRDVQANPIDIDCIGNILSEIIEALENGDSVLIADMLQYEVIPILEKWYDEIASTLGAYKENA